MRRPAIAVVAAMVLIGVAVVATHPQSHRQARHPLTALGPTGAAASVPLGLIRSARMVPAKGSEEGDPSKANCFPESGECGYPSPTVRCKATCVGVEEGITLKAKTENLTPAEGATVKELELTGGIEIKHNNVTVENADIIAVKNQECGSVIADTCEVIGEQCKKPCNGTGAIRIASGVTGTIIKHTEIHGASATGVNALHVAIADVASTANSLTAEYDYIYNASPGFDGPGTYTNNYVIANDEIPEEHYEDALFENAASHLIYRHNVFLNPHEQTAAIFMTCDKALGYEIGEVNIEYNFLAGGGYTIYGGLRNEAGCKEGESGGFHGPVIVKGNRFARCLASCPDTHGYWKPGGNFGTYDEFDTTLSTLEGNYWDNNLEANN